MPRLTSLERDGWELDDGEVAHAASPESYWIPSRDARAAVEVGDVVKLRFQIRVMEEAGEVVDYGERMWVEVEERAGDWRRGVLKNQPTCTDDLRPGLEVWFQPCHVIDIFEPAPRSSR